MKRDARSLSTEAQHELRIRAVKMKLSGMTYKEVSGHLDIATSSIQNWMTLYHEGGFQNLKPLKRGRKKGEQRTLSAKQEKAIQKHIAEKTPEQLKMDFALWTRPVIREFIRQRYGIELPVRTLGEYLKRWGYTPQRPKRRAYEQQPEEVKEWLDVEYPKIEKRAKREDAEILWSDETGFSNQDNRARGYAPKGKTPVARGMAKKVTISMISAVSNRGALRFMMYKGALNTEKFLEFLKRLIKGARRKIFLIVDNLRVHKAKRVRQWLEKVAGQIELFFIPPYSPELNPDEYLNQTVKAQIANKPPAESTKDLGERVRSKMRSNQRKPELVKSLFAHPAVRYAA